MKKEQLMHLENAGVSESGITSSELEVKDLEHETEVGKGQQNRRNT